MWLSHYIRNILKNMYLRVQTTIGIYMCGPDFQRFFCKIIIDAKVPRAVYTSKNLKYSLYLFHYCVYQRKVLVLVTTANTSIKFG